MSTVGRNILFSLVSFLIFLLLLEGGIRLGVAIVGQRMTMPDVELGWYHVPNARRIIDTEGHRHQLGYNSHGFRLPEHRFEKDSSKKRLVVLGDSFVDGSEVGDEETFTWLLQEQIEDLEVINLGVYGFSTAQQLITLEKKGLRYNPDMVILMTMTNDYTDNLLNFSAFGPRPRFVLKGDSLLLEGTAHPETIKTFRSINLGVPAFDFFHRYSYLYYVINNYLYQRLIAAKISAIADRQKKAFDRTAQEDLYLGLVERMQSICRRSGVEFLVVFVYPKIFLQENEHSPTDGIRAKLAQRVIASLDLFNALREAELSAAESLYYVEDFHWNRRGHRFVADYLREQLSLIQTDVYRAGK